MITIYKAMMALAEDYVGNIRTASLSAKEEGKPYTDDGIKISGMTEDGRRFCLELTLEDREDAT